MHFTRRTTDLLVAYGNIIRPYRPQPMGVWQITSHLSFVKVVTVWFSDPSGSKLPTHLCEPAYLIEKTHWPPYPKRSLNAQRLVDTENGASDGTDFTEKRGEKNLNPHVRQSPRRAEWQASVRGKGGRMSLKKSSAIFDTRWRRYR